jgi:membrane protease YdiL (CAAX protease family)
MSERADQTARTEHVGALRSWIVRHPISSFLVLVYATTAALAFVPKGLTEPGLLPGGATPHGILENVLGSAVPAFIVTALVAGRAGVRDLARRSFRWRVPLRWYAISLLGLPLIFLICVTALYGLAPLRALAQNWLLIFTSFLPALLIMILLSNVAEEIGWTGFVFARLQDRHGPLRAALLTTVFFWLFPCIELLRRHPIMGDHRRDPRVPVAAAPGQPIHRRLALQRRRCQRVDRWAVPLDAQRGGEPNRPRSRRL